MDVDKDTVTSRCTEAVFDRGQKYRRDGHIRQLDRFDDLVTAAVQGSNLYDVTIEFGGRSIDTRCSCPYDGGGDCKHIVAVLLDVADGPPADDSEHVESVLEDVPASDVRAFLRDALATHPGLREQFLAQFGDDHKSVEEHRKKIEQLFEQHADPGIYEAIDFSQFFELADTYRDRQRYLAAATVYRAIFEEVDDKYHWVDGAYDHYAQVIQRGLDGYANCVLATDPTPAEFDTYAGVVEARTMTDPPINTEQFHRALEDLEDRYEEGSDD
ncbi:SWIM zinc finger protein [Halohasta litchfieldiae]|jgi:uncharacterized Zn finger protein|uniref:SWIM zinc finger n=1 Tax=Halohasta litchfieldiae TaxID=1073996 RepID=A0A1H6Y2V0_9EURY|nr:SWIM zinc finger family protein [Halohasta litchfieldiae]ATW88194.1 SWIM zinc finger protein [Halohasta litchfieldiae]SEJ35571.1 SWIM zinc finger [Halohasta litchfieldiae]